MFPVYRKSFHKNHKHVNRKQETKETDKTGLMLHYSLHDSQHRYKLRPADARTFSGKENEITPTQLTILVQFTPAVSEAIRVKMQVISMPK